MSMFRYLAALPAIVLVASLASAADRSAADAYLVSVPTLVKDANYKTMEDMCNRALQADDTCPNAHYHLGLCHEKNGKPRDAFKEYQAAANFAAKEKDAVLGAKATAAARRIGVGLMELDALDLKLAEKLHKLADEAFEAGQLETAKQAYAALVVLHPDNAKAKEGLDKATTAIIERGDPVKSKVAAAMLAETWYKLGIGKKAEAAEQAKALSNQYGDTEFGKEATAMLERDFAAPKKDEVAKLTQKLKVQSAKIAASAKAPATSNVAATQTTSTNTSASRPPSSPANKGVDVEAVEKTADEETKKMPKDALVSAFKDAHKKGKSYYSKATPGSEGNQENVAHALEQFIKAESLYQRIEDEKLTNEELAAASKEASMLRYGCMKMTILAH